MESPMATQLISFLVNEKTGNTITKNRTIFFIQLIITAFV